MHVESWNAAKWEKEFIRKHNEYKKDSVVSDEISYNVLQALERMEHLDSGREVDPKMLENK